MTDAELRLRCMELAMQQAKIESVHTDRNAVADIQTWFYNRIVIDPAVPAEPEQAKPARKGRAATDKSAPIFE